MERAAWLEAQNADLTAQNRWQAERFGELETLVGVLLGKITVLEKLLKGDSRSGR